MNYPSKMHKSKNNVTYFGNRGMDFEEEINITNSFYLQNDIAVIYKKPTPITINTVDYKSRRDAVITKAHFKTPSTTDYNGVYKGKYIDFEAKETKLNYFPLANIHSHQIEHLRKIEQHGGIGFILVYFKTKNKVFYLPSNKLFEFIENSKRKSIPLEYFEHNGFLIEPKYNPRIDYISVIDYLIKE